VFVAPLASPETAERIAVLEAAARGQMSPLMAARLNVARAGGDLALLDGLHAHQSQGTAGLGSGGEPSGLDAEDQGENDGDGAADEAEEERRRPLGLARASASSNGRG
jgi:hypothetical protein